MPDEERPETGIPMIGGAEWIEAINELTVLIHGAHHVTHTAQGQNLLPLARVLVKMGRQIFPPGTEGAATVARIQDLLTQQTIPQKRR